MALSENEILFNTSWLILNVKYEDTFAKFYYPKMMHTHIIHIRWSLGDSDKICS